LTPARRWSRVQPELCHYKARYRDDDSPVDDWSDTVEVTARP
jgi:hypothetical protein